MQALIVEAKGWGNGSGAHISFWTTLLPCSHSIL